MSKPRLEWRVGVFVLVALVLLGGLLIEFSKGTTFFLPTNHILMRAASGFLQRLAETAGRINSLITNVTAVLLNEHTLTNLSVAVDNVREVSQSALETVDNINRLVGTNGPAIAITGSNLVVFSQRLD